MRPTLSWLPLLAAACGPPVPPDLDEALSRRGGCSDLVVFAVDEEDRWLLTVEVDDLVASARETGQDELRETLTLPAERGRAALERGSKVSDAICDDVIENGGPRVDMVWLGVGGDISVTIRRVGEDDAFEADVSVENLVLDQEDGPEQIEVQSLIWSDIAVGWLPG